MLQKDKQLHFLISFFIVIILKLILGLFWACIISFGIGILKETYDHFFGNGFDWKDLFADLIGIIVAIFLIIYD